MSKKVCVLDFSSSDVALIITGCICPVKEQRFLVLADEQERLRQYVDSIVFYIEHSPFTKIVFCDNSAYPYDAVDQLVERAKKKNKTFEWLSFQGDDEKIKVYGKGYGEGEIIRYALDQSQSVIKAKSFAKVTGRLIIANIDKVVAGVKAGKNYFNRDIYRGHGIDTRFYLCDKEFYCKHLMGAYTETCELPGNERALEDLFYVVLNQLKKHRTLKAYPAFQGKSGGNGRDYSQIPKSVIRTYSFFCKLRLFNRVYAVVLGIKKCRLVLTRK